MKNPSNAGERPGPARGRWTLSLRALLSIFLLAVAAYALIFSGIVALRIEPAARAMLDGSHTTMATWVTRTALDSVVLRSLEEGREVVRLAAEGRPAPQARRAEVAGALRALADSNWLQEAGRALTRAPQPEVAAHLALATSAHRALITGLQEAAADIEGGRYAFAARALASAEQRRREVNGHLIMIEQPALMQLFHGERTVVQTVSAARRLVLLWAVGAALLAGALGVVAHRRLYRPLADLESGLERVGAGDLDIALPERHRDEMGRLAVLFNRTTRLLADRTAEQRRRSENLSERLGRILDDSSSEIVVFDAATLALTQMSRGAERNLGLDSSSLASHSFAELVPELTSEALRQGLAPLRSEREERVVLSCFVARSDGTAYPAEVSLHYSGGEVPPVFVAVIQDVSERIRLREERDRIFELSVDMLVAVRTDGTLLRLNPAFAAALGYAPAELNRKSLFDMLHVDDRPVLATAIKRLGEGEPIRALTVRMQHRNGSLRWVSWSCDRPVEGVLYSVGRDVTADRDAETAQEKLQAAVERVAREWTQTFDAIENPILIVNGEGRILRFNDGVRRIAATRPADLVGRTVREVSPDELWARADTLVSEVRRDGRPVSAQVRGTEFGRNWTLEATPVRLGNERMSAVILVAHDVTRLVEMQESLRRSETMAALGSLLAGVAHEVRNPLFSMTATLDAFEARHGESADGQHFRVLRSQLARMQQLMQDLLDYGRPRALEIRPTETRHLLATAVEAAAVMATQHEVKVELTANGQLPSISVDPDRLTQVFVNLIINAVQHSPRGSSVTVEAGLRQQDGRDCLEVVVADRGSGFAEADLPLVFEPFYSRRKGGTGLGLAIVRRIVEQHGGRVSAANNPGGGGLTRVTLPLNR